MSKSSKDPAPKAKKTTPKKAAAPKERVAKEAAATGAKAPRPPRADRPRDPRLPKAGTVLQRPWHGKVVEIEVGEHDFTCGGKTYTSLSALARAVTGAPSINGFLWVGLAHRPAVKSEAATRAGKAKAAKGDAATANETSPKDAAK